MKTAWIILILMANFEALTGYEARKCCKTKTNLVQNNRCVPDKLGVNVPIELACIDKYVLNPNLFDDDIYNVTSNGSLVLLAHVGSLSVSPEE